MVLLEAINPGTSTRKIGPNLMTDSDCFCGSKEREYNPETGTYHIYRTGDNPLPISDIVVRTLAAVTGREPTEIEPLYHVVDPEALDALFQGESDSASNRIDHISFPLEGHEVTVYADGEIVIAGLSTEKEMIVPIGIQNLRPLEFFKNLVTHIRKWFR